MLTGPKEPILTLSPGETAWPGSEQIAGVNVSPLRINFCWGLLIFSIAVGLVFFFFPEFDLWASRLFYHRHSGFVIKSISSRSVLPFLPLITKTFVIVSISILLVNFLRACFWDRQTTLIAPNRTILFLLLSLAIGPGLLVNVLLKYNSGRARPIEVREFGGEYEFTKALVIGNQCERNCSFVSGDASLGFYGLAFAFIARRRRKLVVSAAVLAGFALGLVRMAQGAHYLSDVFFSGVFTYAAVLLTYLFLFRLQKPQLRVPAWFK